MTPFRTILAEAERRNGGAAGLGAVLPNGEVAGGTRSHSR
jgi:hypothetical protein